MKIEGIGIQSSELLQKAQKLTEQVPGQIHEFEQVLQTVQQQGKDPHQVMTQALNQASKTGASEAAGALFTQKMDEARKPGGIEKLLCEIDRGQARLNELIREVKSGRTFTPQELIGLQSEMHQLTLQLETTTKVVSQVVQGVKQLMQQQV